MKTEVGRNWYKLIHFYKLSGRQVSFSAPQWTPSREEHKRFIDVILTGRVSNISQWPNIFVDFLLQCRLALKNDNMMRG